MRFGCVYISVYFNVYCCIRIDSGILCVLKGYASVYVCALGGDVGVCFMC